MIYIWLSSFPITICWRDYLFSTVYSSVPYWRLISFKWSEVAQSCPTLCDPMDYSLPGSSVHGVFQARILEWVVISFSRRSSQSRDWTWVSLIVGRCLTIWATGKSSSIWVYLGALYSVPLIYTSVLVPIPWYLDYCTSEVLEGYASSFALFPQDCFGNSGSFVVPHKF